MGFLSGRVGAGPVACGEFGLVWFEGCCFSVWGIVLYGLTF